ncbi:MAG: hypothetical protein NXI27_31630, partial [Alphaproteobacteria bacterium]|nr:hypothetical protein [Alphaproteobacteria bacterium]
WKKVWKAEGATVEQKGEQSPCGFRGLISPRKTDIHPPRSIGQNGLEAVIALRAHCGFSRASLTARGWPQGGPIYLTPDMSAL